MATDDSSAAVASAEATTEANGVQDRVDATRDDAMTSIPSGSVDLIVCNPPFHLGSTVHPGAAVKLFAAAGRVLRPGGELWSVFNTHLEHRAALQRFVGPTRLVGRNAKFTVSVSTRTARAASRPR